jgi:hypothetical protein
VSHVAGCFRDCVESSLEESGPEAFTLTAVSVVRLAAHERVWLELCEYDSSPNNEMISLKGLNTHWEIARI